jgi:hypothetical protein
VGEAAQVFEYMSRVSDMADASGHAVCGVGLRPLACWDCGLESPRGHECLSFVSVMCC